MNYIISFPRSGQHLVESIIRYLYSKLDKRESHKEIKIVNDIDIEIYNKIKKDLEW